MNSAALQSDSLLSLPVATTEGEFIARYSAKGLAELKFPSRNHAFTLSNGRNVAAPVVEWHRLTTQALQAILAGRAPTKFPPLDLSCGTEFQQSVWRAMSEIPFGQTQSYGEIAVAIKNRNAVRAVGGACGANPIPVLVPCHRVLAANQKIGGFSSGLDWKRKLLALENISVTE